MPWKPVHEAHSIDRVRILIEFNSPLTSKVLTKAAAPVYLDGEAKGFSTKERVANGTLVNIMPNGSQVVEPPQLNGYVLKRLSDNAVVEEVGFRDSVFGYVTTEYGRWENLTSRIVDVFFPAVREAAEAVDFAHVRLEYWDRFIFEGPAKEASADQLLSFSPSVIPQSSLNGDTLWHSHAGWFEEFEGVPYLFNMNIDAVDLAGEAGTQSRGIGIYSLAEARIGAETASLDLVEACLDELHRRSIKLLGNSLSADMRDRIGINLEKY